jgi:hypothetical protein
MRMKCPLCHKDMLLIGGDPIGWDCPTKNTIKESFRWTTPPEGYVDALVTHYFVRGSCATVTLFPFKVETWVVPEESPGVSTVSHWLKEQHRFDKVFSCPAISLDDTDKLLARLKLLMVFS